MHYEQAKSQIAQKCQDKKQQQKKKNLLSSDCLAGGGGRGIHYLVRANYYLSAVNERRDRLKRLFCPCLATSIFNYSSYQVSS